MNIKYNNTTYNISFSGLNFDKWFGKTKRREDQISYPSLDVHKIYNYSFFFIDFAVLEHIPGKTKFNEVKEALNALKRS